MADFFSICSFCYDYSRYEKKTGGHYVRFFGNWGRKLQFFAGFCMCLNCKSTGSLHQTVAAKKTAPRIFFSNRQNLPDTFLFEMRKKKMGVTVLFFCSSSTNKTVSYRQLTQLPNVPNKAITTDPVQNNTRPLHPMDRPWRSQLNSELWTSSIAIRFRSSRGSLSSHVTTGSSWSSEWRSASQPVQHGGILTVELSAEHAGRLKVVVQAGPIPPAVEKTNGTKLAPSTSRTLCSYWRLLLRSCLECWLASDVEIALTCKHCAWGWEVDTFIKMAGSAQSRADWCCFLCEFFFLVGDFYKSHAEECGTRELSTLSVVLLSLKWTFGGVIYSKLYRKG